MSRGLYTQVSVPGSTWRATLDLETNLVTIRVHVFGRGLSSPTRFHWNPVTGICIRYPDHEANETTRSVIEILKQLSDRLLAKRRN